MPPKQTKYGSAEANVLVAKNFSYVFASIARCFYKKEGARLFVKLRATHNKMRFYFYTVLYQSAHISSKRHWSDSVRKESR